MMQSVEEFPQSTMIATGHGVSSIEGIPPSESPRFLEPVPANIAAFADSALPANDDVWTEWRTVPQFAPSLLLSSTHLLNAQYAGPVLRPGARYRVDGVRNGIVALRVVEPGGDSGFGFCTAVDLICIDKRFTELGIDSSASAAGGIVRSAFGKIRESFSRATSSVLGISPTARRPKRR